MNYGYHKSYKVERKYNLLIEKSIQRREILKHIEYLDYIISSYDDTYSDADEFPYSKDIFIEKLNNLNLRLKKVENF